MSQHQDDPMQDAVAIIGMSCRFPGAESVDEYWQNLKGGVESICVFSDEELLAAGIKPETVADPNYVKVRGLIKDPELFDAAFFGISPREAELMDPQQRLFLESCWHALESAGQVPSKIEGSVGVWGGMSTGMTNNTYLLSNLHANNTTLDAADILPTMLGNENDYLTTRVSYKLNLRGPSINVQSACSTSLVAAAQAFQSLMTYGCDMALAGGVSVSFPQKDGYMHQEGDIGSPDGHCRPFDENARGTVFSNGVGVVLMKRLEDALADDDYIYAVIRGVALNNDGSSKVSFAAPSVDGQAEVIAMAQAIAEVEPSSVSYIETHGTGTALGDPIEFAGLVKAFGNESNETGYCGLGSVKSNFGHLDSAAGVAALIKTALCLHHKTLVPTLHFNKPNPGIDLNNSPFYVCRDTKAWDSAPLPRRAGVSGFGIGGTNAHLVLEEAPARRSEPTSDDAALLLLSAKTEAALKQSAANLAIHLQGSEQPLSLADVSYTLATGREQFRHRLSLVATSIEQAASALGSYDKQRISVGKASAAEASVVFMFPGGGAQYHNMAKGLYHSDAEFRSDIDKGLALFQQRNKYDLASLWFAKDSERDHAVAELERPSVQLPAIFILEMALAALWMRRGITPDALIGHSMGENTAACLAGVMSYEDALGLVSLRGELFEQVAAGGMLSVALSAADVQPYLHQDLCLATVNAPDQCTISGAVADIETLAQAFERDGIDAQSIPIKVAAHSHLLDPILQPFGDYLRSISLHPPSIPVISNRSGDWLSDQQACDPQYWVEHLRHTVMFADGVNTLAELDQRVFLEVGPGRVLGSLVRLQQGKFASRVIPSLRHALDDIADSEVLLAACGRLWSCGVNLDREQSGLWAQGQHIPLPLYPFQRKRFLVEPNLDGNQVANPVSAIINTVAAINTDALVPETTKHSSENVSAIPRQQRILDKLQLVIQELSGLEADEIDPAVSFTDMGFDSLFLTQANLRFKKEFRVKITFRQLFDDAPCLAALAEYIDKQLPEDALPEETRPEPTAAPAAVGGVNTTVPQLHTLPAGQVATGDINSGLQQAIALQIQASNAMLALLQNSNTGTIGTSTVSQAGPTQPAINAHIEVPTSTADAPSATGRFGPFKPVQKSMSGEWSAEQQAYLEEFIEKAQQRTLGSKRYTAEHRPHFADPRVVSGFKTAWKEITYPIVGERSKGSKMWDIDGNEYVDCAGGFGATFFGHAPDFILDALRAQLDITLDYGPQSKIAGPTAKLLCDMTGHDRASFCNTGSEAVLAAMRIARTTTGNDLIVTFSGDYHGIFDEVLVKTKNVGGKRKNMPVAPGIPASASNNILVLDYGDPASLDIIKNHADELAAVLVEPIQSRTPELQPVEFIQQLRKITKDTGIPLIFDEIITGFRLHPRGAQAWYNVEADICCYGKVVGGGMPIGIVAGKSEYMDALDGGMWQYGDDSFPEAGVTYFAGTFIRHPMALVAVKAVLEKLNQEGPALQADITRRTAIFSEQINRHYHRLGVPLEITYFGSVILPRFYGNPDFEGLFYHHLRYNGVHIWEGRPGFLTTAHSDDDMQTMIDAFVKTAETLIEKGFFPEALDRDSENYDWTPAQREIWLVLNKGDDAIGAYNEQIIFEFDEELDQRLLELTLDKVVNRHASLRSVVQENESGISVLPYMAPAVEFHDLTDVSTDKQDAAVEALARANIDSPFDFKSGPLTRFSIIRTAPAKTLFCWSVSHLVCDGWSMEVALQDIAHYYTAMKHGRQVDRGTPPTLEQLAELEQEREQSGELEDARQYWQQVFDPLPENMELPLDHPRPRVKTYAGKRHALVLDQDLNEMLRDFAKQQNCTLFVVLLGAYYVLLNKLSSSDDIVVGIPAAGHPNVGLTDLVTHMVSFLPVRKHIDPSVSVNDFLLDLRNRFNDAKENQDVVYGDLVNLLQVPRDPSRLPLLSASFNMDLEMSPLLFDNALARFVSTPRSFVKYELHFNVIDENTSLALEVDHNSDLLDTETVLHWVDYYQQILRDMASCSGRQSIKEISLLSDTDKHALQTWNRTASEYPKGATVIDLLDQQAVHHPDKIAVTAGTESLSYEQLQQQSNQLARHLQHTGVAAGDFVGICLERSVNMLVATLAVWKAGAAYIPLDPTFPTQRLLYMMDTAAASVLLTESSLEDLLASRECQRVLLDSDAETISSQATTAPDVTNTSASPLAYVIFTSGSTGKPKGVKIPHRAVTNFLYSMAREPGLNSNDRLLAVTTLSFDIAVLELYLPLVTGASLVIASSEDGADGSHLRQLIEQHEITTMQATPASWRLLLASDWQGNDSFKVLCGGEALPLDLAQSLLNRAGEVWNMYGPTETTVWSTCYRVTKPEGPVLIGHPIANTQCYVLDADLQAVPTGVAGELYIGGDGVADGYIGLAELTAERFIVDPFSSAAEARLYRTGDRVRWTEDGELEYIERVDNQVKLRGFRIELGEIEKVLLSHPQISECAAAVQEFGNADQRLVAYVCYQDAGAMTNTELRRHIRDQLPQYMIPQLFVELEKIPLTPNGKINRKALPKPLQIVNQGQDQHQVAPSSETERQIALIWNNLLQIENVGVDQYFFDIGGHSLLALEVARNLESLFGVRLTLQDILLNSLGQIASQIELLVAQADSQELSDLDATGRRGNIFKRILNKKKAEKRYN